MKKINASKISNAGKRLKNVVISLVFNILFGAISTLLAIYYPEEVFVILKIFGAAIFISTISSIYDLYKAGDYLEKSYLESEDDTTP